MLKQGPSYEDVMWVRHNRDKGMWWPGLFISLKAEKALVVMALRQRGVAPDTMKPTLRKPSPGAGHIRVPLFWIPYHDTLVVATQWRAYADRPADRDMPPPPSSGDLQDYVNKAVDQMKSLRSLHVNAAEGAVEMDLSDAIAPGTPSTVCGSACSTVTPASSVDATSPVWYGTSSQKNPQPSPASSASSTSTELDVPSTQLSVSTGGLSPLSLSGVHASRPRMVSSWSETTAAHSPNTMRRKSAHASSGPILCNSVRESGRTATGIGGVSWLQSETCQESTCGNSGEDRRTETSSPNIGTKRVRSHMVGEGQSSALDGHEAIGEASPASHPAVLDSRRRKKECLDRSQHPRLGSPPAGAVGPLSYRNSCVNHESEVAKMKKFGDGDTRGDAPESSTASLNGTQLELEYSEGFDYKQNSLTLEAPHDDLEMSEDDTSQTATESSRRRRSSTGREEMEKRQGATHQATHSLVFDTAQSSRSGVSPTPKQRDTGKLTGWLPAEPLERSQTRASVSSPSCYATRFTSTVQQAINGKESVAATVGRAPCIENNSVEAADLRRVGVTGKEGFQQLIRKLKKLKWRYGGPVNKLETSSNSWIMRPGATAKTAQIGVDKFATNVDVVRYVRQVLGLSEEGDSSSGRSESDSEQEDARSHDTSEPALERGGKMSNSTEHPLTPEMQDLQRALESLRPSSAPAVLKQRSTEFRKVLQFLTGRIEESSGGSMYLCGCPGTGKTQTMAHVQAEIQRLSTEERFPTPAFHSFTGTAFTNPNAMPNALWRAISGQKNLPANIEQALSMKLTRKTKPTARLPMIVVVVDEIDQLMSESQRVLRNLFEWADTPNSRMILVGIANSIGFDVGFSDLRSTPVKVCFGAYTPEELRRILEERVGNAMDTGAVNLCAKKVASTHGDARRAISVCREAIAIAKRELHDRLNNAVTEDGQRCSPERVRKPPVTIGHMAKALRAARVTQYEDAIAALSLQAQIVLCVAAAETAASPDDGLDQSEGTPRGKRPQILTQGGLHAECMRVWGKSRTGGGLTQIEFSGTIDMLAAQGLLGIKGKQHASGRARQLVLQIEFSDVAAALGDQPFFKAVTGR